MIRTRRFPTALFAAAAVSAAVFGAMVGQGAARAQTTPRASGPARAERPSPPTSVAAAGVGAVPVPGKPVENDTPKVKVERGVGGKKVYRITEEIRIEGKIQKPEAFFFYQKSSINYDWQELKQDFIPRILDSVNQSPF
jgi:hypothetical protein